MENSITDQIKHYIFYNNLPESQKYDNQGME